jgi:hypothetical protein
LQSWNFQNGELPSDILSHYSSYIHTGDVLTCMLHNVSDISAPYFSTSWHSSRRQYIWKRCRNTQPQSCQLLSYGLDHCFIHCGASPFQVTERCIHQSGKTLQAVISDWISKFDNKELGNLRHSPIDFLWACDGPLFVKYTRQVNIALWFAFF